MTMAIFNMGAKALTRTEAKVVLEKGGANASKLLRDNPVYLTDQIAAKTAAKTDLSAAQIKRLLNL